MSLRFRAMALAGAALAVTFSLTCYICLRMEYDSLQITKQTTLAKSATIVSALIQNAAISAASGSEMIGSQSWVAEDLHAGDRTKLLTGLKPIFERLKASYNARVMNIWLPPATAFLRVQDINRFGDDSSASRPMVVAATVQGKVQQGIEIGPSGIQIRGIAPIKDENGQIGALEYAGQFQALIEEISTLTDSQIMILADGEIWKRFKSSGQEATPERDLVIGGHVPLMATNWDLTTGLYTAADVAPTRGDSFNERRFNGVEYGILSHPLIDFSGQRVGFLVSAHSFADVNAQFIDNARQTILTSLVAFILAYVFIAITFNGFLLRPLTDLVTRFRDLADGQLDKPLAIPGRTDEIGIIAESGDRVRHQWAATVSGQK